LHRDIWDVSGASPKRVDSARVSLGVLPLIPCPMGRSDTVFTPEAWKRLGRTGKRPTPIRSSKPDTLRRVYPAPDNDALIDLLDSMAPERSGSGPLRSGQRVSRTTVLYLDFPGNSSRSWSEIYRELARDTLLALRTYVHPFIFEHASSRSRDRFELIFQYWFFYPFNDGANDHEGDWEHINVSVTTRDRMASMAGERRLLDWTDLDRILEPGSNADDVVLSAVDYYFHHFVVTVDYNPIYDRQHGDSSRRRPFAQWLADSSAYSVASAPRGHCSSAIDTTALSRLWGRDLQEATEPFYDRTIQERFGYRIDSVMTLLPCGETFTLRFARRAETKIADWLLDWVSDDSLATHPVGYIAGNNKSVFQLLESRSGNNNNSHGTYPFPGIWRGIASGSSEKVGGGRPRKERAGSEEFLSFGEKELMLVADWERRTVSLSNDPERRRDWAWLVLPIRWGYPATQSPGAELLKNFDFGQAAPEGPAFNLGWNSVGAGPGFERYDPASLSLLLNNSPVDYMDNRWGRWNIPILGLAALPPISALASIGGVAFTRYVKKEPGYSFHQREFPVLRKVMYGPAWTPAGQSFTRLLPGSAQIGAAVGSPTVLVETPRRRTSTIGFRVAYSSYFSSGVATESSLSFGTARLRYRLQSGSGEDAGQVTGRLSVLSLLGAMRGDAVTLTPGMALFLRGGAGWTWYRVDNARADFIPADGEPTLRIEASGPKRFPLHVLPNTVSAGAGLDVSLRGVRAMDEVRERAPYGLRLGLNYYHTKGAGGWWDFDLAAMLGSSLGIGLVPLAMGATTLAYIR
jgi:hypothetical protein